MIDIPTLNMHSFHVPTGDGPRLWRGEETSKQYVYNRAIKIYYAHSVYGAACGQRATHLNQLRPARQRYNRRTGDGYFAASDSDSDQAIAHTHSKVGTAPGHHEHPDDRRAQRLGRDPSEEHPAYS